ncbi:magnesium-dependent phosphatase-1 [Sulfolobus acidocaldarius SUSAZ]|nr:magnesium-dependent phosphatase-1 [Sulfolobus acidocaldarius SUSAZ]
MIKLVVFDADKTLWTHSNISIFRPPIRLIDENSVEDSIGNKLRLFENVRETLSEIRQMGLFTAMATWNIPEKTELVLSTLKLKDYFDVIVSNEHPYKFLYIIEIINKLSSLKNVKIKPDEIIFVDDRRSHFGNIWLYVGKVNCLEMWVDVTSYTQLLEKIKTIYKLKEESKKIYNNA